MPKSQHPQVVHDCHEALRWVIPQLDKFPRSRRFTLGERIESLLLQVLERCLEAAYSPNREKKRALQRASQQLGVGTHLWRLAMELKVIPPKTHAHGSKLMVELGSQIGGWQRYLTKA